MSVKVKEADREKRNIILERQRRRVTGGVEEREREREKEKKCTVLNLILLSVVEKLPKILAVKTSHQKPYLAV